MINTSVNRVLYKGDGTNTAFPISFPFMDKKDITVARVSKDNETTELKGENVTKYQLMADTLISDTSSTIYEFLLLSRPVITLGTISKDIYWENITEPGQLIAAYDHALTDPEAIAKRQWIVDNYDPYLDGNVCQRMLDGAEDYIRRHGVPKNRKLNLWRKYTSIKTFGRIKKG